MFYGNQTEILNEMIRYSELMHNIITPKDMEGLSVTMAKQIEQTAMESLNPFVIHSISHNLCSKYLVLLMDGFKFPDSSYYLLSLMFDRNMVLPVYQTKLSELLSKKIAERSGNLKPLNTDIDSYNENSNFKFNMNCLKGNNSNSVNMMNIVNLDSNAQRYAGKRFGYALLDLEGKFLWADDNSQKLFEMKAEEMYEKSIFNLMIPHSKLYLKKKFGNNLFGDQDEYGESIAFFYVIYSKNSANKLVKLSRKLKKRQPRIKKTVIENENTEDKDSDLYYTYLKTLSSKCTMIALTFTKSEIQDVSKKYGRKMTMAITKGNEKINNAQEEDFITKKAILLETRLGYNKPKFKFSELETDPQIQKLKDMVAAKIKKAKEKEERKNKLKQEQFSNEGSVNVKLEDEQSMISVGRQSQKEQNKEESQLQLT